MMPPTGVFGVAGTDHRVRVDQAMWGMADKLDLPDKTVQYIGFDPRNRLISIDLEAMGQDIAIIASRLQKRDAELKSLVHQRSQRPGDRAVRGAWERVVWFADYTYLVSPFARRGQGQDVTWRANMEVIFGRAFRRQPVVLDSCGYRREIAHTAQTWARIFEYYPRAIEVIDPDGFAGFDFPRDKKKTLEYLDRLQAYFPNDPRLWPVFSVLWSWNPSPALDFSQLPGWASKDLGWFIPLTKTQRRYKPSTLEACARLAIANALLLGSDPAFKWMVDRFGKVMIGGLIASECPRIARHLYASVLVRMYPGVKFWLLGQASPPVLNGLGMLELLDDISSDSTSWLLDASLDRILQVEGSLLTVFNDVKPAHRAQLFFTRSELMAAGIRGRAAAYHHGLIHYPAPKFSQLNLADPGDRQVVKSYLEECEQEVVQQLKLGIG